MNDKVVEESYNTITSNTNDFTGAGALKVRLDPSRIMEQIELFLTGNTIVVKRDDSGGTYVETVHGEEPLANSKGVQAILSFLHVTINAQTVQGNYTEELYYADTSAITINLACNIIENMVDWGINEKKVNFIIDTLSGLIYPFYSRLLFNKERESYYLTLQSHETFNAKKEGNERFKI